MTLPRAMIPFTSRSVKKLVDGPDLISFSALPRLWGDPRFEWNLLALTIDMLTCPLNRT
jgi:hypothetical protein